MAWRAARRAGPGRSAWLLLVLAVVRPERVPVRLRVSLATPGDFATMLLPRDVTRRRSLNSRPRDDRLHAAVAASGATFWRQALIYSRSLTAI